MPSALSVDLRERVVAAIEAGASRRQAAKRFAVRAARAVRWHGRFRQDGQIAPKPMGGDRNVQRPEAQAALIVRLNEEHPLSFLRELRDRFSERGVRASTTSLWRFFARHGITRKKGAVHSAEPERSDVRATREDWFDLQPDLDPDRLVFLDESAATPKMVRRYGRAPCGRRCRIAVPHGHDKTTTISAARRATGLIARTVFDGATNGMLFRAYVTDTLAPVLRPGDTVILDNLNAHEVAGICEAIEAVGARVLDLPPYSPDFNPIEQVFATLKSLLRTAAARTAADLSIAIEDAFAAVRPDECRNCLTAAGYDAYEPT
ncbi:IS630 family transposase [Methylobacterium brachiatum]|uniref:IS630 family transposase n=1 Tax=Methylobacterium brachiatum TaxID=269660 RepID=UPI00244A36BF|nr:IS630 family transposase [Methylobacterium brachiatum]MDH2313598.1 IS630 family transposase [Methylobacterium brachiatum]